MILKIKLSFCCFLNECAYGQLTQKCPYLNIQQHLHYLKQNKKQIAQKMDILKRPADEFGNDTMLEELWAKKAFEHADTHFNLLISVDPRSLKLTPFDDQIYKIFREDFPNFRVDYIDENNLKSDSSKIKWRNFIEKFNKIEDYAFGTLIRVDSSKDFSPENSILVVRIQFLAIEIARNREGFNDNLRKHYAKKYAAIHAENNNNAEISDS